MQMQSVSVEGGSKRYDGMNRVTAPAAVSLWHARGGLASGSRRPSKKKAESIRGTELADLSLASSPGAVSRDLSTDAFILQYLCCRRDHQGGYYDEARNFAEKYDWKILGLAMNTRTFACIQMIFA